MNQPLLSNDVTKKVRFVDRDGIDERSYGRSILSFSVVGRFGISRKGEKQSSVYLDDWFHSFASLSTGTVIVSILLAVIDYLCFFIVVPC